MGPNDDARLVRIEQALTDIKVGQGELSTFVKEEARRTRKRLDEVEETVDCQESGLVVKVDRIEQWKKRHSRLAWLLLTLGLGGLVELLFRR